MKEDTIAAIASGLTQSGIGVIRISGPKACDIADRIFRGGTRPLAERPTHTIHYGYAFDEEKKLDEVLAMIMRAPHSFTAEDVVELQCHGGPLVMQRILSAVLKQGARLAEPGEFTKRAFLNGRIDLSQAEAVMDLIRSQSDAALETSIEQLSGALSVQLKEIRGQILYETAYIEAALDDPEHISLDDYGDAFLEKLNIWEEEIQHLIDTADEGKWTMEGIRTVILGRPNAGKSSLLNCLVGEERAIVTSVAGTTRDTLEETINMGGFSLRLIDTAGIRETEDEVEKIGVERAKKQAESADLLIYMVDSSEKLDQNDREIIEMLRGKKALVLMNKIDLEPIFGEDYLKKETGLPVIAISAKEGTGIGDLKREIEKMFRLGHLRERPGNMITSLRQKEALMEAARSLKQVRQSVVDAMPEDFWTIDLMGAYAALGKILGEEVDEDLVDQIFSKFCMGK